MFKNPLINKLCFLLLWSLLLNIPLLWINELIRDRQQQHDGAIESIADSSAGSQTINGPYLIQPYIQSYIEDTINKDGSVTKATKTQQKYHYILPTQLSINATQTSQMRTRGIFSGLLYHTEHTIEAEFLALEEPLGAKNGEAYLSLGIGDSRGIHNTPALNCRWQDDSAVALAFLPGAKNPLLSEGVHAPLASLKPGRRLNCTIKMALNGTQSLYFMPLGQANVMQLQADWPHPKFTGNQLPIRHAITEKGFSARWESTHFAVNIADAMGRCAEDNQCEAFRQRAFGVDFVAPVNSYTVAYRAVTYAMLFILLTFGACFLFEVLTRRLIHPMQYGLISAAMTMFYILLLALGEHMSVVLAYGIAACACVALLSIYLTAVLGAIKRGIYASLGFAVLYGLLFCVLQSEDYALLFGSMVLFCALGLFMLLTRHLNWGQSLKRKADTVETIQVEV